eukprot:gnl/TRDRNA2_/TRDRNA2_139433_c1_seq2.p1 gnl/TRDRNA2_/TRDRNA2_139433_c1~~gnl/TRDRNA2_/TRDRNA2_139433_c1_seq2.p1  ORF type:complete len:185 (+),score=24.34 gnl/TRDRNA2_/TRDRNA2_139433_c1_seq2:24-557(+)
MHGSVYRGYGGSTQTVAEFNVRTNPAACRAAFLADWLSKTITPLDTCGSFWLDSANLSAVHAAQSPLACAVVDANRSWFDCLPEEVIRHRGYKPASVQTTILFDCVAVHLAYSRAFLDVKRVPLHVTDDGFTKAVSDENYAGDDVARNIDVAVEWQDMDAFARDFVERLTTNLSSAL